MEIHPIFKDKFPTMVALDIGMAVVYSRMFQTATEVNSTNIGNMQTKLRKLIATTFSQELLRLQ